MHHSRALRIRRFEYFASQYGFMFWLIGETDRGGDVVICKSFRYKTERECVAAIKLVRGANDVPVVRRKT